MKRLIVCCDGTWNTPDQPYPTNVAKLRVMLPQTAGDGAEQRVYYDTGVGTGAFDRIRGGAFGWGLSNKIKDAYRFLMAEYEPGRRAIFFRLQPRRLHRAQRRRPDQEFRPAATRVGSGTRPRLQALPPP
ncbi:MAG: phospholipase effector Tle1 domain-containing protein [Candidatus Acidiferrales bacterium]